MTVGPHSRRDALKILGAGAAIACAQPAHAFTPRPKFVPPKTAFFGLGAVRLGDGPFLAAQKLEAAYLLSLEPDRMLANFRKNAGLLPKAPVYGGWESVEPWIEIRCHGHTLGHYLGAAACMYESTGDARFAERVDYIVAELAECQAKTGGWLTAFPDGVAPLTDSLAGKPFPGVPWYTTHKVLAGLRDAHVHRGSQQALEVLVRFANWIHDAATPLSDAQMQKMLDREHGGMNEVLADVFVLTNDQRFASLADKFCHAALLGPLSQGKDYLTGLHANTQIPKVIGFSRLADIQPWHGPHGKAAKFFWHTVVEQRSFATGGHGDNEHFFPVREFPQRLPSAKTMETCCTHNMLRLTRSLYARDPEAAYFDYFERALFNGILASQDPDSGMTTYFQATRPGYVRLYHTPFDSFWCCTGSGMENHARYGESIYARNAHTLYVNLFLASTLDWRERGVTLTQETRFPDADTTRLIFNTGKPQTLRLALRQPAWCAAMTVTLNGKRHLVSRRPGRYCIVERMFRAGDVVELRLPMALALEPLPNAPANSSKEWAAIMYGPIVLAGRLGTQGLTSGAQLIVNERESGNMLNEPVDVPRWSRWLAELLTHTSRTDAKTLRFTTRGFDGGKEVELIPWFRMAHERYNLYWQSQAS
ncbi:MAG TPA: beta-L-arabinofuranosidase domain-containing protein [Steroidobacteraceae bacterium]|nr:beta-L-arabinofuranosidase domain-containing protein [Steroidobacteraceae bacterium]